MRTPLEPAVEAVPVAPDRERGACRQCEAACPNGIPIIERMRAAHAAFARLA